MRNSNTRSKTFKKKLNKSKKIFYAFSELQYRYGEILDTKDEISEIKANIKLDLEDNYTSDFYIVKTDGSVMVRECVYKDKLMKPNTIKLLDISRNYWLSKGIENWGLVLDE